MCNELAWLAHVGTVGTFLEDQHCIPTIRGVGVQHVFNQWYFLAIPGR
jgi:hypothetical protein